MAHHGPASLCSVAQRQPCSGRCAGNREGKGSNDVDARPDRRPPLLMHLHWFALLLPRLFNVLPCSPGAAPGCTRDSGLLCASTPPFPEAPPGPGPPATLVPGPEPGRNPGGGVGWEPSKLSGGPMAPGIEVTGVSGVASESSASAALWEPLAFLLVSSSRGSSWQRWPMFLLIQRVHGLSCQID